MYDVAIAVGGGVAFGIITFRVIRMSLRMHREYRRQRLLSHLDWSVDEFGRRRNRA